MDLYSLWLHRMAGDHYSDPILTRDKGRCVNHWSVSEFIITDIEDERLSSEQHGPGRVFWTRDKDGEEYDTSIQLKIRCLLSRVIRRQHMPFFTQFWGPKQVGDRSILTTSDQPFALFYGLCKGVSSYRKKCTEHRYIVDDAAEQEQLGPPGRVFRNWSPESRANLCLYSVKEFPLRDHVCCGLGFYIALPLFDLHYSRCVGVLEFVGYEVMVRYQLSILVECIDDALKEIEMRTTPMSELKLQIMHGEYVYDHQRQVNDRVKLLDLNIVGHSISESRENLQMSEMVNTKSVEEQEQIDLGKSMPGDDKVRYSPSFVELLMDSDDDLCSNSVSEERPKNNELEPTKAVEEQTQNIFDGANSNEGKEREKKKTSFHISYEDIEPHFGKTLGEAANALGVSRSTLKRARKDCGITRWPSSVKNKKNPSLFQTKTCNKPVQSSDKKLFETSSSSHLNSGSPLNSNVLCTCIDRNREVDMTCQETNVVTVKAKFKEDIIKFDMCLSSGLGKLMYEVAKRVNLTIADFKLKYKDDDGDLISLTCDEDLHYYVKMMKSLGKTTIQVLVHLVSS